MNLAALAEQEGMKPKPASVGEWLAEHPGLEAEVQECRAKGFTWADLAKLLRKHYQFPFVDTDALRRFFDK